MKWIDEKIDEYGSRFYPTVGYNRYHEEAEWLRATLTKVAEEARREERERILNMIPSERRMVHHVVATGSQEDLNDTFRRGYNKCRNQVLEILSDS